MKSWREKYFGDKAFYSAVLAILVPMVVQNVITNFVSMLDNIMVGQLGTAQMNGVSIANQYVFIFNITIFGGIAGPSIFGAQFFGKKDYEGQKQTLRFRLLLVVALVALFSVVYLLLMDPLLMLYIAKDDDPQMIAETLAYGREYMNVIVLSLIPFGLGQAYSSVVRECGETKIPMYGSAAAVLINLFLDYGLIFGNFGMPELGVAGAAWATVIAKVIEAAVVIVWAHTHHAKNPYIVGLFKGFRINGHLLGQMIKRGLPLLINEFLWVVGVSVISQCYSIRGLDVVGGRNIANVITNLFGVVYIQIGSATSIILGNKLGAGKMEEAKDTDNKLLVFSLIVSTIVAIAMLPFVYLFPQLYNTTSEVRDLASYIILITAVAMPLWAYTNTCYFTLRSGGRTGITFLFDFVFAWVFQIPLCYILAYHTNLGFRLIFAIVTYTEIIKVVIGFFMVRSNIWIQNIVDKENV